MRVPTFRNLVNRRIEALRAEGYRIAEPFETLEDRLAKIPETNEPLPISSAAVRWRMANPPKRKVTPAVKKIA